MEPQEKSLALRIANPELLAYVGSVIKPKDYEALLAAEEVFFGALAPKVGAQPMGMIEKVILSGVAINEVKGLLRPLVGPVFMPLMNSAVGFDTDKNPAKGGSRDDLYSPETVLDCVTEGWMRGLPPVGNLWNIIAGGFYVRQEGFAFLLQNFGVSTHLAVQVPNLASLFGTGGYTQVRVNGFYRILGEGKEAKFSQYFNVRVNAKNKVAVENVEGKARRKAYKMIYQLVTADAAAWDKADEEPEEAGAAPVILQEGSGDEEAGTGGVAAVLQRD